MHMKGLLTLMLLLGGLYASAQQEGHVWIFGSHAGIDFSSGSPVAVSSSIETIEGSASISDGNGQLLFYTEGSTIWDRNGNVMPNGTNLTGLAGPPGVSPTASTTQSSVIVPIPDSSGKYYVFSLTDGTIGNIHNLYYSVVDMSLNGGFGDVIAGRKGILLDSMLSEKLTAGTGKCCNIWVVVNRNNGNFHAFEITAAGLNTAPVISPSGINNGFAYNFGEIKFSPDGNHLAAANQSFFGLKLYDFNGYTGVFSNIRTLRNKEFYGACFSPDNTKLYGASDSLYQYNVTLPTAAAITGSQQRLTFIGGLTTIKSGPDGKLYFQSNTGISAVTAPNLPGPASLVTHNALALSPGTFAIYGNFSNEVAVLVRDTATFTRTDIKVCFKDSITIAAPAPGCDYLWTGGVSGQQLTATANGSYVVEYRTPPCVYHADTFVVQFVGAVPLTGAYSGCGESGTAYLYIHPGAGDTATYNYQWRDSLGNPLQQHTGKEGDTLRGIDPGWYTVTMSGQGCDTTIGIRLLPAANIRLSFSTDTIICIGDTSYFTNTATGFDSYFWLFGDGNTSTAVHPRHLYQQPGHYTVSLIGYPCGDTARATVYVDSLSYLNFVTDKKWYCAGEQVLFLAAYPEGISQISWDFGDGTGGTGLLPGHAYDTNGSYVIRATASFRACPDTADTDTVQVYPFPVVDLGPDTFLCLYGPAIPLGNLAPEPAAYRHWWQTGDTTADIIARTIGTYSLTVTNEYGCATTDSMVVKKSCYLDIPNVFTPNGDGVNDYFFPRNLLTHALTRFHMQIFNRWGEKIFETGNTDGRGWDGQYGGKPQPQGVYIYLIEAAFANGGSEQYKGNVTLLY